MATITLNAVDFASREALELSISQQFGATPEAKDVIIDGTREELLKLNLSHGDSVWGVIAQASDYQEEIIPPRVDRGAEFPSMLNGIII